MKLILISMITILIMITIVSAEVQTLGTYKQFQCIELRQICSNCTYNNISSITLPNSTIVLTNLSMTKSGTEYNYTFCNTSVIGNYIVSGFGDVDGIKTVWAYDLEVTSTGYMNLVMLYFIIFAFAIIFIIMGFVVKDGWITIFGTFGLYLIGIFIVIYGIEPLKNLFLTRGIGLVVLGIAAYISINSALQMVE